MNWYVEQNGVSVGPLTEQELVVRVRSGAAEAETLIWHPGLEAWQSVQVLKPEWLRPVAVVESPKPATPTKTLVRAAARQQPEPEAKPGFFKRLFGKK